MNTIWVYGKDEPNLRERLMGMEFDRAILSEMAQRDFGIRAHVLSRTRAADTIEQNRHIAQQEALAAKQALETVVENANSLQQLKAKIAAVANEIEVDLAAGEKPYGPHRIVVILRQLSAV